jgi:hypothetical protein
MIPLRRYPSSRAALLDIFETMSRGRFWQMRDHRRLFVGIRLATAT